MAAGGVAAGEFFFRAPQAVRVEELSLSSDKLAAGRELRVVQLSDLHIRTFQGYLAKVARLVDALEPDLILLTGDYLEQRRNIHEVRKFLQLLHAPLGIFAVQGNWEYWSRLEGENLRGHFARAGATLLINQRHDIEENGLPLSVLGLDYPSATDQLRAVLAQADPVRLNFLLSHVPAFDHESLDGRIDLILSGHTHGGQVRIPFIRPYLPRFSGPYIDGLYHVGPAGTPLYVTRGIGTSVLPVRLFCPPEITLVLLRGQARVTSLENT
jgi:uncharacterized protein